MTPSGDGRALDLTIEIFVAGVPLSLIFAPAHARLVDELRSLWTHMVVPAEAGVMETARAAGGAAEEPIEIEFVPEAEDASERPEAVLLRPGPSASYAVSGRVTRVLIQALRGHRLLLHAGAVEIPGLGVVVMVGASGAGKSTATVRLGRRGRYLTDELTILDPRTGALTPYSKPVSLRSPGRTGKCDLALAELDLSVGAEGQAPQWILLLERLRPGQNGEPSSTRRVPLAEAVLRIVGQSSSIWKVPGGLAALAEQLNAVGGAIGVSYHEAEEIESLLHGAPPPIAEVFEVLPGDLAVRAPGPGEYAVSPFVQALRLEDGVLVLTEREVTYIPGLGGLVWEVLRGSGGLPAERLEERLVRCLGSDPEQSIWLEQALADLLRLRLVSDGTGQ